MILIPTKRRQIMNKKKREKKRNLKKRNIERVIERERENARRFVVKNFKI
jgi:hypothetical protein